MLSRPVTSATLRVLSLALALTVGTEVVASSQRSPARRVAITIDNLPFQSDKLTPEEIDRGTGQILEALARHRAPAIGFVNEIKLAEGGGRDAQVQRLKRWLDPAWTSGTTANSSVDAGGT